MCLRRRTVGEKAWPDFGTGMTVGEGCGSLWNEGVSSSWKSHSRDMLERVGDQGSSGLRGCIENESEGLAFPGGEGLEGDRRDVSGVVSGVGSAPSS